MMESEGGFRPLLTVESTLVNAAHELYTNGLITQDTHTDVTTHQAQPTQQRASLLLAAVGETLKASPDKEQIVLRILDTNNDKVFPFHDQVRLLSRYTISLLPRPAYLFGRKGGLVT